MERPNCPVCGKPTVQGIGDSCHCGKMRLLSDVDNHYLSFKAEPPSGWPEKGCPICGRPMQEAGKFHFIHIFEPERIGEGLERLLCDQPDHYCYVTKAWYIQHQR